MLICCLMWGLWEVCEELHETKTDVAMELVRVIFIQYERVFQPISLESIHTSIHLHVKTYIYIYIYIHIHGVRPSSGPIFAI